MVFLLQPLFCLGAFRESEFRSTEINGEVKSSIDPLLESVVLLNPAIKEKVLSYCCRVLLVKVFSVSQQV